jgi:tetratricopeptide (TPR) repeat protein
MRPLRIADRRDPSAYRIAAMPCQGANIPAMEATSHRRRLLAAGEPWSAGACSRLCLPLRGAVAAEKGHLQKELKHKAAAPLLHSNALRDATTQLVEQSRPRRLVAQPRRPCRYRGRSSLLVGTALLGLCVTWSVAQPQNSQPDLDRAFQSATAHYEAKEYAQAEKELRPLVARLPASFEVNELMGLVYAAQGLDEKANAYLKTATHVKPNDAAARTNLAVNLVHLGKETLAEAEFKKALELEPQSFDANHNLGEFYVHSGKLATSVPYLTKAQSLDPTSDTNGYDLAVALLETGELDRARRLLGEMIQRQDTAELRNLLAETEEKAGDFMAAVTEYERAAHMEPSEKNIFDWGSELLLHQTLEPAVAVFRNGVERYPQSVRMQIGLGIALYSRQQYDEAVKALARATDLAPLEPFPYEFLARVYNVSAAQADEVVKRLQRFVQLQPENARANYYYALALWKGKRDQQQSANLDDVESLLKKATALDPRFADAHLQLGIVYTERHQYAEAIDQYRDAIRLQPNLGDAHYRLGQALVRMGDKAQAQEEFEVYDRLHKQHVAEGEKERAEIKQFIYNAKAP